MSRIDDAVRNILTLKYQLGLFDDPMRGADAPTVIGSSASRQVNLEAARESITLLKNEDHACLFRRPRTFSSLGRLLPSDDFYGRGEEVSRARLVIKAPPPEQERG